MNVILPSLPGRDIQRTARELTDEYMKDAEFHASHFKPMAPDSPYFVPCDPKEKGAIPRKCIDVMRYAEPAPFQCADVVWMMKKVSKSSDRPDYRRMKEYVTSGM